MKGMSRFVALTGFIVLMTSPLVRGPAIAQIEDVTPPELVNFSLSSTTIDTGVGPFVIDATVEFKDEGSGVDATLGGVFSVSVGMASNITMHFGAESPLCAFFQGEGFPDSPCVEWVSQNADTTISDDGSLVTHQFPVGFAECTRPLDPVPFHLVLTDKAGNVLDLSEDDLAARGFPSHLEVTRTLVAACRDLPDLTATPVRFKFRTTENGDVLRVDVALKNTGNISILGSPVTVTLSLLGAAAPLATETIVAVDADRRRRADIVRFRLTNLPSLVGQTVVITLDPANEIREKNEENNQLFFTIGGTSAPQPLD